MSAETASSELDIFGPKPVQSAILGTTQVTYKPTAGVEPSDLEFVVPSDNDTYIDTNIHLYIRGKLTEADGTSLDGSDFTAGTNNFLHSLFSQCSIALNGTTITPATDLYNYRSYFETILCYGSDAAATHLANAFWYLDDGNLLPCNPTTNDTKNNQGFIARWNRMKQSKEVQMYGRLHSDICNVSRFLLPGVQLYVRLTKAKSQFYLMNEDAKTEVVFKFLDAQLLVNRVTVNPDILAAHNITLRQGPSAIYNMTKVELKTFTFSSGSHSLSIDNVVLGPIPKRLLFTMVKNTDYLGSVTTNPYRLHHYDISYFALNVNGKQIPTEGLSLGMDHEKLSVMGYRTLFEGSGIHHLDRGLQITHDMYINGYFMLLFDLTPDRAASEEHASHSDNGNIRVELKFSKALPDPITCIFYLEFDNSIQIDYLRRVTKDF
jgi:hypothetical protein